MELLALIPDSDRFRELVGSEMSWVDVAKQIDAFGHSENPDAVRGSVAAQGYWPDHPFGFFRSSDNVLQIDQALSIENQDQAEFLSVIAGIEPESVAIGLRELGYKEIDFDSVTVLVHEETDLRKSIEGDNRFIAVLKGHDAVAYASSEPTILEYAGLIASNSSTMDTSDLGSVLKMLHEESWTQSWLLGAVLDKTDIEFSPEIDVYTIETIRGLGHLEKERFGVAPEVLKVAVGIDAGLPTKNLRNPDATPIPVVEGYREPREYIFLQYASAEDAQRASEIIEWRWENAISWRTGEPLTDLISPEPIDQSQIETGVILQTFADRFATHFVGNMIYSGDLSIYGWGSL